MILSKLTLITAAVVALISAFIFSTNSVETYEASLLTDWSHPPPWSIFIFLNALAATLHNLADALTPPPVRMINLSFDFYNTVLAHICSKYDIAEFLSTGPKSVKEIAEFTKSEDVIQLERVMYAMASIGITKVQKNGEDGAEPKFVNTPLSATLRKSHPQSMWGMIRHTFEDSYQSGFHLSNAIGPKSTIPWDAVYPEPYKGNRGIWAFYNDHPDREEQFSYAMMAVEGLGGQAMSLDAPFHKFDRLVDIGGSMGHFLYKNLQNNPDKTGVLFDLPKVTQLARKHWEEEGLYNDGDTEQRLKIVSGSFLEPNQIPSAKDNDVFYLRYILHDWNKEDCVTILKNLKVAMKGKKATLMIGECAIPNRNQVGIPAMHKIDMQMMNVFGQAMERTPEMWKELLDETGFDLVAIHPTRSLVHFVEAVPRE